MGEQLSHGCSNRVWSKICFEIIDNARNAVKTASQFKRQGSATGHAELNLVLPPDPQEWSFSLVGERWCIYNFYCC